MFELLVVMGWPEIEVRSAIHRAPSEAQFHVYVNIYLFIYMGEEEKGVKGNS